MAHNTSNLPKFGDFYSDPGLLLCVISPAGERSCNSQQDLSEGAQNSVFLGVLKQRSPPDLQQLPPVLLAATTTLLLLPRQLANDATQLEQIFSLVRTPEAS